MSPQLATLAKVPPGAGWIYEIKFDGYRLLARLDGGVVRLFTRNGNDWTDKMRGLADELATLQVGNAWLDGEAVVLNDQGVPDFNALQNAFDRSREQSIIFFAFDVLFVDGVDMRSRPQSERSARLRELLATHSGSRVRMSEAFDADGATALRSACAMGLEGLIAKKLDAPYSATRSKAWLKLKCNQRREFVVGGFTERDKASHEVGSLLLGIYDASGDLIPAGSVGTGWDSATARKLKELLAVIETPVSPFKGAHSPGRWSRRTAASERWVEPRLIVDVTFQELTPDGLVRHASFKGARVFSKPDA